MPQSRPFQQWFEDNREWVQPYAAFCFLRDLFGNAEHWHWGSLSRPTQQVSAFYMYNRHALGVSTPEASGSTYPFACNLGSCATPCDREVMHVK